MATIDRDFFFKEIRARPFSGPLSAKHVSGCNAILDYWEQEYGGKDDRWLSYLLGTAYHETAHRMEAIHEYGGANYFNGRYGPQTSVGQSLGNTQAGDGHRFHGRGFVQLTGRSNYKDWKRRLDIDLVSQPDLALDAEVAAKILIKGSALGTFTGVKLSNYFSGQKNDWHHARQIINGLDKAGHIADLGKQFWAAISYDEDGQAGQAKYRPVLREGSDGEDVRFLQRYLGTMPDGSFGPMTEDVVIAHQRDNGLTADGIVGRGTWTSLLGTQQDVRDTPCEDDPVVEPVPVGDRPLLRFSSTGDFVKELQGLLGISQDGEFGPMTLDKVKGFQADNGLQADGIVGRQTWEVLLNA